jgi:hypothetical protein
MVGDGKMGIVFEVGICSIQAQMIAQEDFIVSCDIVWYFSTACILCPFQLHSVCHCSFLDFYQDGTTPSPLPPCIFKKIRLGK